MVNHSLQQPAAMNQPSRPFRVRSEIAADMAQDLDELRELKQLQSRIFQQLRVEQELEETEQREKDMDSLVSLTQLLLNLTRQLRAERDALRERLADEERVADVRRMVDEIAAFASARQAPTAAYEEAPEPSRYGYSAPMDRGASSAERRPLRSAAAHAQPLSPYAPRPARNAWALRS